MHIAAAQGHMHAVVYLVEKARLDPWIKNDKGQLALSVAKTYDITLYLLRGLFELQTHSVNRPRRGSMMMTHANERHGKSHGEYRLV